ncbi:MAG: hemin uptake protein HemP [Hyphomicrobiaceae bacterium]
MSANECDEPARGGPSSSQLRRIPLQQILQGAREVIIEHDGQDYRLRVTSRGKLLLTK